MGVGLGHYLALASTIFGVGALGFLLRRNVLIQLMSIELMLNAVNLMLVAFNRWAPSPTPHTGQIFAFFVIAIAAAEAAVGLSIVIGVYRLRQTVHSDQLDTLRH